MSGFLIYCVLSIKVRQYRLVLFISDVDSRGAGGARASPEFGGSVKGQSLISAYRSLAITASTSGFEKLFIYGAVCG